MCVEGVVGIKLLFFTYFFVWRSAVIPTDDVPEVLETVPCVDNCCVAVFGVGVGVGAGRLSAQMSFPAESDPIKTCALPKSGRQYQPPYTFVCGIVCFWTDTGFIVGIGVRVRGGVGVGTVLTCTKHSATIPEL